AAVASTVAAGVVAGAISGAAAAAVFTGAMTLISGILISGARTSTGGGVISPSPVLRGFGAGAIGSGAGGSTRSDSSAAAVSSLRLRSHRMRVLWDGPWNFGSVRSTSPVLTVMVTVLPGLASAPPAGACEITAPTGTVLLAAVATATTKDRKST